MRKGRWPVAFVLLPALGMHALAFGASLTGTVVVSGVVPTSKKLDVVIDQFVCGTEKDAGDLVLSPRKELKNAVVWIENPPADAAATARDAKVEIDQKACVFAPRVVTVPVNDTIIFRNSDRLLHNVHTITRLNAEFNKAQATKPILVTFSKPEIVRIACDLHPWMTAWVVVAEHRYYAVTNAEGRFSFDGLPSGQYKLKVWHERLGTIETSATVGDQPARIAIEMKAR